MERGSMLKKVKVDLLSAHTAVFQKADNMIIVIGKNSYQIYIVINSTSYFYQ